MKKIKLLWTISPLLLILTLLKTILLKISTVDNQWLKHIATARQHILSRWFAEEFKDVVDKYREQKESADSNFETHTTWLLWMQGIDQLPQECQITVDSIKRYNDNVCFLDYEHASKLVKIPEFLSSEYREGRIKDAHMADYIRFALLERYGGQWMDVSLLQIRPATLDIYDTPIWSVKGLCDYPYAAIIPMGTQWQVYYMASRPHALFNKVMLTLLESYYERYSIDIDYFVTYYLAELAMTIPAIRNNYAKIPCNNQLCEIINTAVTNKNVSIEKDVDLLLHDRSTWICKCSTHYNDEENSRLKDIVKYFKSESIENNA